MFETVSLRAHANEWHATGVFLIASLSACALIAIGYVQAAQIGVLVPDWEAFGQALLITACVALPIGFLGAYHHFQITALTSKLQDTDPVDDITGLISSHLFERMLTDELARMDRSGRPSAIVIFELDHFAQLSMRYGDGFANAALKQVAASVHCQLRGPFDRLCRWNGGVFVALMNDVSIGQAEFICERLRESSTQSDLHYKGHSTFVTLSFGVAPLAPGADIAHAFERAHIGLEKAQRYGGNKVSNGGAWVGKT